MSVYALHAAALKALLPLLFSAPFAQADSGGRPTIEVFTTSDRPIDITASARRGVFAFTVYRLDGLEHFETYLSQQLPREPKAAETEALRRLQHIDPMRLQSAKNAARGLTLASEYGIDRVPAVVFDGRAVVYGVTVVEIAIVQYRRRRDAAF
ncbi:MAG: TIGR03757 family integrating conjugative element protein [Pseudomonadota bacterium]|jgi:integrating conjugative element protein (TIGR03757 family)